MEGGMEGGRERGRGRKGGKEREREYQNVRTHSTWTGQHIGTRSTHARHTLIHTRTDTPKTSLSRARCLCLPLIPPPPPYLPEQDCHTESKIVFLSHACPVSGLKFVRRSRPARVCARFTCASMGNTNIYEIPTHMCICTTHTYVCVCKRYVCVSVNAHENWYIYPVHGCIHVYVRCGV